MNSSTHSSGTPAMRIVDGGSPAPTFWSFVFGHNNLKPSVAAKVLIGGHCLLVAYSHKHRQHKQHQWSDSVQVFILDVVKLAVIQQFWMKECDIFRGIKTYSDPPTYFQGVRTPVPRIYAPASSYRLHIYSIR